MDPTEESLSALSTQLVSLGYLSRPLDLATLFLAPSLPAGASSKHARKHQELLILQARAREQIAKCLWGMLEQRQTERETIETLLAREARANEEADREQKAADRARKEREAMGRQLEAEKARAKEAEQKLRNEQDRHRHARDELAKAKNALQFVKTQALHDQKRRESEVQSLHQRLQKLTTAPASSTSSESAFTRFTILNGASPASSPVAATFAVTQTGRSASRTASRVPTHAAIPSAAASALEAAELELVRTTLDERISACSHLERENRELRTFVGEVGEWAEGVLEIEELASVRKDREEGGEMREVLNDGDESYLIPAPHLALPVAALTSPLHRKLYAIRLGVSSLSEQSAATLASVRDELEGEIERLHEEVEEEVIRREEVEKERETALEAVRKGEQLVEEWALKAQAERRRRLTGSPASDDEGPVPTAEGSNDIADKRRRDRAPAATDRPTAAPTTRVARPSAPSAHVADFLADLGLDDTPAAAEKEKAPLRTTKVEQRRAASSSSHRQAEEEGRPRSRGTRGDGRSDRRLRGVIDSRKEKEDGGDMLPPPPPMSQPKTTTTSLPSSSRSILASSSSRASTVSGSTTSASITTSNSSSSRSSRRQDQEVPSAATTTAAASGGHPSSTLQDILALADSPLVTSEPLISTAAAAIASSRTTSRVRPAEPRQVLVTSSSRVVNAPTTAAAAASDKTEELGDRVAAKKQALLARARSASSRKVAPPE